VVPTAIGLAEINRIYEVLDRLGVSREAVVIPLQRVHAGTVRVMPNGKTEIRVESEGSLDDWLPVLEQILVDLIGGLTG